MADGLADLVARGVVPDHALAAETPRVPVVEDDVLALERFEAEVGLLTFQEAMGAVEPAQAALVETLGARLFTRDKTAERVASARASRRKTDRDVAKQFVLWYAKARLPAGEPAARARRYDELLRGVGLGGAPAMVAELESIDLELVARQACDLLDGTRPAYERHAEALRARGVHDLRAALRAADANPCFSLDACEAACDRVFDALGLPDPHPVVADLRFDPRKQTAGMCAIGVVPREVWIVTNARDGFDGCRAVLHELAHARRHTTTDPMIPFAERHLGEITSSEGLAMLFDRLLCEPAYWAWRDMPGEAAARDAAFVNLVALRQACVKALFEIALVSGEPADACERSLRRRSEQALLFADAVPRAANLGDLEMISAKYVRGWMFEAAFRRALAGRFGTAWFAHPQAGAAIRGLFALGSRFGAETILALFGESLNPGALLADVTWVGEGAAPRREALAAR
jgi:hypothetical protein